MKRTTDIGAERVEALLRDRSKANARFFAAEAERLARLCHKMAERFAREGRLVAFGASPADRSDARHVAVEFVHPVIVGKRALPALGLAGEGGQIAPQVALEAEAEDIAMAFGNEPDILAALAAARERGCLTIAFTPGSGAEWEFDLETVADPLIRQEITETLYHTLWEHVHIFLDQRGLLEGRAARPVHDSGASSFLYPFLGQQETDLDHVAPPCLCAMHPHQPSRAVGRSSENKSALRKKVHRCVDADECEAPMRDQAVRRNCHHQPSRCSCDILL